MSDGLAVVLDVAGTLLRMYRVAKDIERDLLLESVITWELVMEKCGRALLVPQLDPAVLSRLRPEDSVSTLVAGREEAVEITCASSAISRAEALAVLRGSSARISEMQEAYCAVMRRCPDGYHTAGMIVDVDQGHVTHALSTGGRPFPGIGDVLSRLEEMGAEVYVASGDSMRSLIYLEDLGIDLKRIHPVASPTRKQEIVEELKERYGRVVMVGDGLNDLYALKAADLGILTVQQDSNPSLRLRQAADRIISDIRDLPDLLSCLGLG
ncbi:MAG: HAD family hydrolase [Methanothrix sp.]|nr:HAD family hydrolase [Methanothrix sp.]